MSNTSKSSSTGIVDLEELVLNWVAAYDLPRDMLKSVDLTQVCGGDINWQQLRISHEHTQHDQDTQHLQRLDSNPNTALAGKGKSHVLFSSMFRNSTSSAQTHNLRTERRTRSTCRVTITKGLSVGAELKITIAPPNPVISANAGFTANFNWNKETEKIVEEELSWSLDSTIEVPAMSCTKAELVIQEDEYDGSFKVDTLIEGAIFVKIRGKNSNHVVSVISCPDISQIFTPDKGFTRLERGKVRFTTMGQCFCRYGIDQYVNLTQLPLEEK